MNHLLISSLLVQLTLAGIPEEDNALPTVNITSPEPGHYTIPVDAGFDPDILRIGGTKHLFKPLGGDNFCNTWAADDKIYVTVDDGMGWPVDTGTPAIEQNNRVWALNGGPADYTPEYLPGFPDYDLTYLWYGFGIVSVDSILYYAISTPYSPDKRGIKLLYSPDFGSNWYRHDGVNDTIMQYVENENTMFFYNEHMNLFSYIDFVQFGKDYQDSKDGYVYLYCKLTNLTPSIYLARVPRGHKNIVNKTKYEYFKGYTEDKMPEWTSDIYLSKCVLNFPEGYYHSAFLPSVVYNKGLDLYIMVVGARFEDRYNGGPSKLTFYWSKNPWGDWLSFYHSTCWIGDSPDNILYQPKLISKFNSEDGKTMYMNYSNCRNHWGDRYVFNQQKITLELDNPAFYKKGDSIIIKAEALDSDGDIVKVEFYKDLVLLGVDTSSQFEYVWQNAEVGNFKIMVLAYDNKGASSASSIRVVVTP